MKKLILFLLLPPCIVQAQNHYISWTPLATNFSGTGSTQWVALTTSSSDADSIWTYLNTYNTIAGSPVWQAIKVDAANAAAVRASNYTIIGHYGPRSNDILWPYKVAAPFTGATVSGGVVTLAGGSSGSVLGANITDTVPVAHGGTGVKTLTAHGVVIGEAAANVAVTAAGTSGQVLTSGGASADPTWTSVSSGFEKWSGYYRAFDNYILPAETFATGTIGGSLTVGNPTGGGTASGLYVIWDAAAGVGEGDTLTVYKNGAATALIAIAAGGSATTANDLVHTVSFAAGDAVQIRANASSGSSSAKVAWRFKIQ